MFSVVWRKRKLKNRVQHSARLVERHRVDGKPRQTFVADLGSYEDRPAGADPDEVVDPRPQFWRSVRAALDAHGIHDEERARIEDALAQRIRPPWHAFEDPDDDKLPEIMSPVGPGYMPLFCAAHWIATQGGSTVINPRDAEVWRRAYGELLEKVVSKKVEVFGDRDGVKKRVRRKRFASIPIVYPFQGAPLELLLGKEMYLCCNAYINEEKWLRGSGDTLRHGRVDLWRHLVVSKADVLRYWPFGANEPLRTGAPGRPSSMHLIDDEFDRRVAAGETETSIAKQARVLERWFRDTHPTLQPPTPTTIENKKFDLSTGS